MSWCPVKWYMLPSNFFKYLFQVNGWSLFSVYEAIVFHIFRFLIDWEVERYGTCSVCLYDFKWFTIFRDCWIVDLIQFSQIFCRYSFIYLAEYLFLLFNESLCPFIQLFKEHSIFFLKFVLILAASNLSWFNH